MPFFSAEGRQGAEDRQQPFVRRGHSAEAFSCPWCAPLEANTETFIWYNKDDIMQRRRTHETTPIDTAGLQVLRR